MTSQALNDETVELQDVESFHFFYKCLWEKGSAKRTHLNILDTIIYQQGRPWRWLFTSNDGTVMKRNDSNLNHFEILRVFKSKAKLSKGRRDHRSHGKIAIVWFVNHRNAVQSYFVDDLQLRSILEEAVFEILAIQLHIGGYPVKGSGVFEHRYYVRKDGRPIFNTNELVHPSTNEVSIYQDKVDRLGISESQHDTIKLINKKIIKFIENRTKGTVANIVLQVVFTSSWIPFITSCRGILLWNPMQKLTLYRSEIVFMCDPPLPPREAAKQNHLLPKNPEDIPDFGMMTMTWGGNKSANKNNTRHTIAAIGGIGGKAGVDNTTGVDLFDGIGANHDGTLHHTQTSTNSSDIHPYQHHTHHKKTVSINEGDKKDDNTTANAAEGAGESKETSLHDKLHVLSHERESDHGKHFAVDDNGKKVDIYGTIDGENESKEGAMNDDHKSTDPKLDKAAEQTATWRDRNKALSRYDDDDLHFRAKPPGQGGGRFLNGAGRRPMSASATGSHFPADLGVPAKSKNNAFDRLSNTKAGGGDSDMMVTASETILPGAKKNAIFESPAYGHTRSSKTKLDFYVNQLKHADSLPVEKLLNSRRPISAPHHSKKKSGSARGVGVPLGGHGVDGGGKRSSGFEKKAPSASGCVCFGDYCFLGEFHAATEDVDAETERAKQTAKAEKQLEPGYFLTNADASAEVSSSLELNPSGAQRSHADDTSDIDNEIVDVDELKALDKEYHKKKKTQQLDMGYAGAHVDQVSPHDLKPQMLKYQLPFRSIILLRSEEDFLKTKIYDTWSGDDHIVESKERRENREKEFRLHDHNKKLLDLTQRHLRRVAYCCLSDVRKTVVAMPAIHSSSSGFQMQWDNLSNAYRKLVYADALAKTHPARFYQTVPMCDTCQFIYSMADMHREEIVMGGHRPAKKNSRGTQGVPQKKWSNGIEEAKAIGRSRRINADQSGSFRSSTLAERQYNNYSWKGKGHHDHHRHSRTRPGGDISRSTQRRGQGRPSTAGAMGSGRSSAEVSLTDSEALFDEYMERVLPGSETALHYDQTTGLLRARSDIEEGIGPDGEIKDHEGTSYGSLVQRLKNETAAAARHHADNGIDNEYGHGNISIGINTSGGTISSWVKMLSDHEASENNRSHLHEQAIHTANHPYAYHNNSGNEKQGRRPHTANASMHNTRGSSDNAGDEGKPNPMGPLAGQGIGGPLGMNYRNYAAPVGFMLGQSSGDVGSTYIDKEGNFLHPKKRSPSDRGGMVAIEADVAYPEYKEIAAKETNLLSIEGEDPYTNGTGIAYHQDSDGSLVGGDHQVQPKTRTRPSTAGHTRKSSKKGTIASKQLQSDMLTHMNLMDLGTYQYSKHSTQRPHSAAAAAGGGYMGSASVNSAEEGLVHLNEYDPNAPYLPLRRSPPKHGTQSPSASKVGAEATLETTSSPLAYLGGGGKDLPIYRSGGTSFEHMIRESQKFHKATLKLEKDYFSKDNKAQNRRVASGNHSPKKSSLKSSSSPAKKGHKSGTTGGSNAGVTGLDTSIEQPTTTDKANFKQSQLNKEVEDIGYLGGLDIDSKHREMDKLYNETQPKLILGQKHTKGPASFNV